MGLASPPMTVRHLDIYLDDALLASAKAGRHNWFGLVRRAFESAGATVRFRPDDGIERMAASGRSGHALFHMAEPAHPRALTTRRAYVYPFWRIEKTNRRWETEVALAPFDQDTIDPEEAQRFHRFWRRRLFGDAPESATREGFVYMPLQGRLREHRSFQSMSPLQMIEATLAAEPARDIRATLHPKEDYDAQDLAALDALVARHPRLSLSDAPAEALLSACDYVVTQNSAVAFSGYFFGKPAVLFARIDFHHVAASVPAVGVDQAFRQVRDASPDFAGYLYWFLQRMAINAGKADAPARILDTVRRRGWDVPDPVRSSP